MYKSFLLINKPENITSHDVVDKIREITGEKKVGHAGTLDPFATGLLIIAIGRESTKQLGKFLKLDKKYRATLKLGSVSDTHDKTGTIVLGSLPTTPHPSNDDIISVVSEFVGKIKQIPPMYSAKKIKGKKLYELARKGIEIERKAVDIEIFSIKIISYKWPELVIDVHCASGTYIRSLAHDIGQKLGVGAYLTNLHRTQIGDYKIKDAHNLDTLKSENWKGYTIDK